MKPITDTDLHRIALQLEAVSRVFNPETPMLKLPFDEKGNIISREEAHVMLNDVINTIYHMAARLVNCKIETPLESYQAMKELWRQQELMEETSSAPIAEGYLKARCKKTGEEWIVYETHYGGHPEPTLNRVSILRNDHSDYGDKYINDIDLYHVKPKNNTTLTQEEMAFLYSLIPTWAKVPKRGLDPTFYGTGSYEQDCKVIKQVDHIFNRENE